MGQSSIRNEESACFRRFWSDDGRSLSEAARLKRAERRPGGRDRDASDQVVRRKSLTLARDAARLGNLPLWVFNLFSLFARLRSRKKLFLEDDQGQHGEA